MGVDVQVMRSTALAAVSHVTPESSAKENALDTHHPSDNEQQIDENEREFQEACRRRTSLPPSFGYGDVSASPPVNIEERRWRSFDSNGSNSSAKAVSLGVLSSRIQQENDELHQRAERLRPRRRRALLRSVAGMFSSEKNQQIQLRQMQMVADVATRNRSLVILNDMRTLVMTMDEEEAEALLTPDASSSQNDTPRSSFMTTIDSSIQRLLDGVMSTDQALADDCIHHMLQLQTQWLQRTIELHADKRNHVPRATGVSPSIAMQQFLSEFVRPDGSQRVPCAMDMPTIALVRFEKLVNRYKLMKPSVKRSFDSLCQDTMASFGRAIHGASSSSTARIWDERETRDVMQSLVSEIVDGIAETAWIGDKYQSILRTFVEQMVYSRLGAVCYRAQAVDLDEQNALWREQAVKARELRLHEVGLPVEVDAAVEDNANLFARSIEAFNRIPHLVPSCVLAAYLCAIRVLYEEANEVLGLTCSCISADVLLPLLVFVLSRCNLPQLHAQVFAMEHYAIETSKEGSESAYYVACLQAAMGYIMLELPDKKESVADEPAQ